MYYSYALSLYIGVFYIQNKRQEVDEHLTTLQQTSEQLQLILNLSVHKEANIPCIEEVRTSQEDIAVKREQLLSFSVDITKLEVRQKEDIDLTLTRTGHSIKVRYTNKPLVWAKHNV